MTLPRELLRVPTPPPTRRSEARAHLARTVDDGRTALVATSLPTRVVAVLLAVLILGAPVLLGLPGGVLLGVAAVVLAAIGVATLRLFLFRPWLSPWLVVFVFSLSAELRLRVNPILGLGKDGVLALLLVVTAYTGWRNRQLIVARLASHTVPLGWLGVLGLLYVINVPGTHGAPWLFGFRLLASALALLVIGMSSLEPQRWLHSLIGALTVMLPLQAAFAWLQHAAGIEALVFRWGYAYGSQVRVTSGGGLRTSGTFEDPFQLAALAIIGLTVALFLARRRPAIVMAVSSVLILGATSVRTTWLQAGILLLIWVVRRGFWRQAVVAAVVAGAGAVLVLATTTTAIRPGAPEEPLLLTLNGRTAAWSNAVTGWDSVAYGNGVGARGIGSTRGGVDVSAAPAYDPNAAPEALFAGDPAFLDSTYAQVLSDVGIVGVVALLGAMAAFMLTALRRIVTEPRDGVAWATAALILVTLIDWIGRSTLASFTTGYLTMFVLGLLLATTGRVGSRLTTQQAGREIR